MKLDWIISAYYMGKEDSDYEPIVLVGLYTGQNMVNEAGMLSSTDRMSAMRYWNAVTPFNRWVL